MKFSMGNPYRSRPILTLLSISVLLPVTFLSFQAINYLRASLPDNQNVVISAGLQKQVVITKDQYGIPAIKAKTDQDAFFAVGYLHAQDRLWQLELQRRMAQGRLSEVFGKSATGFDIYIRTLRIYKNAIASVSGLSPAARDSLQAYADGINAWLAEADHLPLEFAVLGIKPEPWQPVDSLAWVKMFALSMSGNFQEDLNRLLLNESIGIAQANTLYGKEKQQLTTMPAGSQDMVAELAQLSQLAQDLHTKWNFGGKHIGSNAWVVAAQHSKNGRALLANDPHLNMELPSMWYIVDVQGEYFHTTGMSIVGSPLVMLGRNNHIAWGATNMLADTMDLYFEQINPENTNQYRRDNQWVDFNIRTEQIQVKADFPALLRDPLEPLKIQIRETDHGPVISDLISEIRQPVSLRWVGGEEGDTSYEAFFRLTYAEDWDSFKTALSVHRAPAMNLFYVDQQDNIGYLGIGDIPIRGKGNGSLPVPGWEPEYRWSGFIPKHDMPLSFNPVQGYLLSANNQNHDANYRYFISEDWAEPERAERIDELLSGPIKRGEKLSVADHKQFQLDQIDLQALKLLPSLMTFNSEDQQVQAAMEVLAQWNWNTAADQIAPTIFFSWMRHLRTALFSDNLTSHWGNPGLSKRFSRLIEESTLQRIGRALSDTTFNWCDDKNTPELEDCNQMKRQALQAALQDLNKQFGDDLQNWQWGKVHHVAYKHRPFTHIKGLDAFFDRKYPRGGSVDSINVSSMSYSTDDDYVQTVGPGFRQIIQFGGDQQKHLLMNSTGQSGNVASAHYDDMAEAFIDGQYLDLGATSQLSELIMMPRTAVEGDQP